MYWENQPELPSDKGSNRSWGATRDIGRGSLHAHRHNVNTHPRDRYLNEATTGHGCENLV